MDADIVNDGTIIVFDEGIGAVADNARIVNRGTITTDGGDAIETKGSGVFVKNTGTLISEDADGIDIRGRGRRFCH